MLAQRTTARSCRSPLLLLAVAIATAASSVGQSKTCLVPTGELLASDTETGFKFGGSIAIDGDTVVVGAELADGNGQRTGSAYVYRDTTGSWVQEAELVGSDTGFLDLFGAAVAIDGNRIVVGATDAPADTPPFDQLAGAAYVFDRIGTTWSQVAKLTAPDPVLIAFFGGAVAVDGTQVLVGAWGAQSGVGRSGAVYAFEEVNGLWPMIQKIVPSDAVADARFGVSLDLDGSDLVIGAPEDFGVCAGDPFCEVGAAYMMQRGPGGWSEVAKLTPLDFADEDHFGISVRVSGGTAVVGTESFSGLGQWVGSAYVFTSSGTDWTQQQKLLPSDLQVADFFGAGLAIEGDRIVVGSPGDDTIAPEAGSFHVFERSGSVWSEIFEAYSEASEVSTNLGSSICMRGDELFVCAPKDFHAGPVLGSVQLFELFGDPVVYCTAKVTSGGCLPAIGWTGTLGTDDGIPFQVSATQAAVGKNGLWFYGLSGRTSAPLFGGTLCMQPPLRRTTIQSSGSGAPPDPCSGSYAFDFDAWLASGSDPLLLPGVILNGQYWMRDPADPFGVGLSDAIEFVVCL